MTRKVFFLVLMVCSLNVYAQDSTFLSRVVSSAAVQPVQEKVYLHLNKPTYYAGDTIWYKAYTVTSSGHRLSPLSGVLYAELIGPKDSVISRQTLKLVAGIAWGEFALPRRAGIYHVRAYTNWMRNTDASYFFNQRIMVLGPGLADARLSVPARQVSGKKPDEHPDIQFLPEGGSLVVGLRSRVAFKAVGSNGLGVDVSGTIVDNDGNVMADFSSQHLGMGVFAITPQPGKTYHAKIVVTGEDSFSVDLPKAVAEGFTLSVDNREKDSIYVRIAANDKLFGTAEGSKFYLVAQSGGRVYYATQGRLTDPVFMARVERSRFPSGIVQFTLFSTDGRPVNERAIFVRNDDGMKLSINGTETAYAPRQKVKINLATDTLSSLSVSVINESRVPFNENGESTILNNLLLTSDLKGYIEQPNYYFTDVNDQKVTDLDVLMLTQGYTRFEWQKILAGAPASPAYASEKALQLEGTLKTPSGKPVPKGKVMLVSTREEVVMDTVTDAEGNFRFEGLDISDTSKIVLRARKENNGSNVNIYVKQPEYPAVTGDGISSETLMPAAEDIKAAIAGYRQEQVNDSLKTGRILNEVTISAKKLPKPDQYNNYGATMEYDADMKKLAQEQIVTSRAFTNVIPGLTYSVEKGFYYHEKPVSKVIIDGFARNQNAIDFLSVKELESVRMIGIDPYTLVLTTRRYAGTDTTSTKLKEVVIHGKRTAKPDQYNHYGTVPEDLINMKIFNEEFITVKDGVTTLIPGLHYVYMKNSKSKLIYEHDTTSVRVIVDGFEQPQADIDTYSPNEIESIRLVHTTNLEPATLVIISKRYAGTDTMATVKLKTVTINARKDKPKPDMSFSSNLHGGGNADQVIMYDEMGDGPNLSDRLTGKVNFVTFDNRGYPINTRMQRNGYLSVIIDGAILDHTHINDIAASDVYSIEVLRTSFAVNIYGHSIEGGGALVITTKRGADPRYKTDTASAIRLKTVTVNAKKAKSKPNLQFSSNLNGPGHADQVLMGDALGNECINLSDCLNGRLAGVYIQSGKPYLQRAQNKLGGVSPMTVIIDGVILDGSHIDDVSPGDIYSVEVLRSGAYLAVYGYSAPGGAIIITTRRGSNSKYVTSTAPAGLITYPFKGFHVARVFYSPKYDHPKTDDDRFDPRSAIYWNPNIITDKDGKASFEYYNADTKGIYRVVIEGIDENGKIGRVVYRYKVD